MVTVLKGMTLYGSRYDTGSHLPDEVWGQCDKRLRTVLERNRFIVPVSAMPPTVKAPSPRRGRKAG